jgi:hypothetical protein
MSRTERPIHEVSRAPADPAPPRQTWNPLWGWGVLVALIVVAAAGLLFVSERTYTLNPTG